MKKFAYKEEFDAIREGHSFSLKILNESLSENFFTELRTLADLEELELSGCHLRTVPFSLRSLVNLRSLTLRGNYIADVPLYLFGLSELEILNLSNNNIRRFSTGDHEMNNLTHLLLEKNELTYFDSTQVKLPKLVYLSLKSNYIKPSRLDLENVPTLKRLNLSRALFDLDVNRVSLGRDEKEKGISFDFKKMPVSLEKINLSYNQISSLKFSGPHVFENLTDINLSNTSFKKFSDELLQFPNLKTLNVENNQLTELPDAIGALQHMEALRLNNNNILSLNENVCSLKNLKELQIENNRLKEIPKEIKSLQQLATLNISKNPIEAIPDEICYLENLSSFSVDTNKLSKDSLYKAKGLLGLYISIRENKKEKVIIGVIKVSKTFLYAIQQYMVGFEKYVNETKGIAINFQTKVISDGLQLEIEIPVFDEDIEEKVKQSFNDYFSLLDPRYIDNVDGRIDELARENEFLKLELRTKISNYKNELDREMTKVKMYEQQVATYEKMLMLSLGRPVEFHTHHIINNNNNVSQMVEINNRIELQITNKAVDEIYTYLLNNQLINDEIREAATSLKEVLNNQQKAAPDTAPDDELLKNRLSRFMKKTWHMVKEGIKVGKDIKPVIESYEKLKELAHSLHLHDLLHEVGKLF